MTHNSQKHLIFPQIQYINVSIASHVFLGKPEDVFYTYEINSKYLSFWQNFICKWIMTDNSQHNLIFPQSQSTSVNILLSYFLRKPQNAFYTYE